MSSQPPLQPPPTPSSIETISSALLKAGVTINVETRAANLLTLGTTDLILEMLAEFWQRAVSKTTYGDPAALFCRILDDEAFSWVIRKTTHPAVCPTLTTRGPSTSEVDLALPAVLALPHDDFNRLWAVSGRRVCPFRKQSLASLYPNPRDSREALWNMACDLQARISPLEVTLLDTAESWTREASQEDAQRRLGEVNEE